MKFTEWIQIIFWTGVVLLFLALGIFGTYQGHWLGPTIVIPIVGFVGWVFYSARKEEKERPAREQAEKEHREYLNALPVNLKRERYPIEFMKEAAERRHDYLDAWFLPERSQHSRSYFPYFIGMRKDLAAITVADKHGLRDYDLRSLTSCELVADEGIELHSSRPGAIGAAILGGALFGGAGAVVGAASAGTTTHGGATVKRLSLKLYFDNFDKPFADVAFLEHEFALDKAYYRTQYEEATKWHARLSTVLSQLDRTVRLTA